MTRQFPGCCLTQISVVRVAELSPSTEANVKRQLVGPPQFAAVIDGCEGVFHVVERHKAIVVPVGSKDVRFNSVSVEGADSHRAHPPSVSEVKRHTFHLSKLREALAQFSLGHGSTDAADVDHPALILGK